MRVFTPLKDESFQGGNARRAAIAIKNEDFQVGKARRATIAKKSATGGECLDPSPTSPTTHDVSPSPSRQTTADEGAATKQHVGRAVSMDYFRMYLNNKRVSSQPILSIWFQYFDRHFAGRINDRQFNEGMKSLGCCSQEARTLWNEIDEDKSNVIYFDEIHTEQAELWYAFKAWCGATFQGASDMVSRLKSVYEDLHGAVKGKNRAVYKMEFEESLRVLGWTGGSESMLFTALDYADDKSIVRGNLRWVDGEVHLHKQKEEAKKRHRKHQEQHRQSQLACRMALLSFKHCLRSKHSFLFRAWRCVLDPEGLMLLQRAQLFKACRQMGWKGNVRSLWKALDSDDSGYCLFEELDPHSAELLAHFWCWAVATWGPHPAEKMFHALDKMHRRKLSYEQFELGCDAYGYRRKAHLVASCFDSNGHRYVQLEDFLCLDSWHPPPWLIAVPNERAAHEFKQRLLNKYGRFVKAWRAVLDKNNSNSCDWVEFCRAAKQIKFSSDVAGAWRFLDADFSGFISLYEFDREAYEVLVQFKTWCEDEFGGVRDAFKVMDRDRSGVVSSREFRSVCRRYAFPGDMNSLFSNLSMSAKEDGLHLGDIAFLDLWETRDGLHNGDDEEFFAEGHVFGEATATQGPVKSTSPGPACYHVHGGMGAGPCLPITKHGGSFSFGRRFVKIWQPSSVGPGDYDTSRINAPTVKQGSFALAARKVSAAKRKTKPPASQPSPIVFHSF